MRKEKIRKGYPFVFIYGLDFPFEQKGSIERRRGSSLKSDNILFPFTPEKKNPLYFISTLFHFGPDKMSDKILFREFFE